MTFTAAEARDRSRARIVLLAEIQTLASGPLLYLSDSNVNVSGTLYADYLGSVTGVGDTLARAIGAAVAQNISITFRNDPYDAFSHLSELSETYPLEGAAVTIKQAFLDDDGTVVTPETIFVGNLEAPSQITAISFVCQALAREVYAAIKEK